MSDPQQAIADEASSSRPARRCPSPASAPGRRAVAAPSTRASARSRSGIGTARGLQPPQDDAATRPAARANRGGARRHAGAGRPPLAHRAPHRRNPEVHKRRPDRRERRHLRIRADTERLSSSTMPPPSSRGGKRVAQAPLTTLSLLPAGSRNQNSGGTQSPRRRRAVLPDPANPGGAHHGGVHRPV
jgi:hypothetical protein